MKVFAIVVFVLLIARPLSTVSDSITQPQFIVWNVGQGLWTTWIEPETCIHYDMGGEHAPWRDVKKICSGRSNEINLSHWDLDHIIYAGRAEQNFKDVCLLTPPLGSANARKEKLIAKLRICATPQNSLQRELSLGIKAQGKSKASQSNGDSHVFLVNNQILLPADSTKAEEIYWDKKLPASGVRILVLGHHGSRTSTSRELLLHLPGVKMAVASAREAKYGHPHKEVRARLKEFGIALLRTEDWGALRFEIAHRAVQSAVYHPSGPRPITEDVPKPLTGGRPYTPCSSCVRRAHKSRGRRKR
jgi:competence protein ComEC